ncbi:MAG: thioredoxin family protein [Sedimentisphaerales bacterium]|nr:thioredoxin family protein [Sedimentisphaerales bacterium]
MYYKQLTAKKIAAAKSLVFIFVLSCCTFAQEVNDANTAKPAEQIITDVVTISSEQQHDFVNPYSKSALAIHFELKKDWHFYASAETAPGGMNLKLKPSFPDYISFSEPIFPQPHWYADKSSGKKLEVFSDKFTVFLPFTVSQTQPKIEQRESTNTLVQIGIEGAVCSDIQCRRPDFRNLGAVIRIADDTVTAEPRFVLPDLTKAVKVNQWISYSISFALGLSFLAGLSLNIMPCVWPVLPLIVMRIVEQAKQGKAKSIAMGLVFCSGILLFFACLAAANIILQIFYGTVLNWGDQYRNPAFVGAMALLLVVLALFMFDVFIVTVPAAISGKSQGQKGYFGAIGMGFLAAILSTPCSFAILAAAFAWAQAQTLPMGTLAIMVIGLGMAVPYAILTSMPGLLKSLPKAGRWMELFKQGVGFTLLIIAVKLITALPQAQRSGVLYFAIALAFCVWIWGRWVSFGTPKLRKWLLRAVAVTLAILSAAAFLSKPAKKLIDWQSYDAEVIQTAVSRGQPVLIKFTADWCLSCQVVDKMVFQREDISELIKQKNVLAVKADTTTGDLPATYALKDVYNEPAVPVSILVLPGSNKQAKWRGLSFGDELKAHLQEL